MKQRLITGLLWGSLAILSMVFLYSPLMGILITLFSMGAVHEIEKVAGVKSIPVMTVSLIFAGALPLIVEYRLLEQFNIPLMPVIAAYIILLLSLMLAQYETTKFEHIAIAVFSSICVPYALSTFMLLRDIFEKFPGRFEKSHGFFLFFLALSCAWITDMFAYFVGRKLGKHKMSPKISPKKSVEGAVGGIIITILFNLAALYIFRYFYETQIMSYWLIIPVSAALSGIGMLGDLSASVIKRNYGVKDFGTLMKGHGGVMDRFDSCIFVFPALYGGIVVMQAIQGL